MDNHIKTRKNNGKKYCFLLIKILILLIFIFYLLDVTDMLMKKEETIQWYTKSMSDQGAIESKEVYKKKIVLTNKNTAIENGAKKEVTYSEKESYSEDEISILEKIVEAETTGGDFKSRVYVANVVLNRVKSKKFPNTIKEVVFQKTGNTYQFSPIYDGRYYRIKTTELTKKAVEYAMKNEDNTKGALYFANRYYADSENMKWFDQNLHYLFTYGGHEFFTEKDKKTH